MIDFAQKARKPMVLIPGPQCMQTIMAASTRARGLETYAYRTWNGDGGLPGGAGGRPRIAPGDPGAVCGPDRHRRSHSDMGNFVDLEHVTDVLGTQFTFVNIHELLDQTHIGKSGENYTLPGGPPSTPRRRMSGRWRRWRRPDRQRQECDMTREEVLNSERFYITVKKMLDYYGCNAFAAPCPDACATGGQ